MIDTTYPDRSAWVALVALLGVPTKDGTRMLSADGEFAVDGVGPLLARRPAGSGEELADLEALGVVVGVFAEGDRLYAVGVADDMVADKINAGALTLGVDLMSADYATELLTGGHPLVTLKAGKVRAVYVQDSAGEFAWS